MDDRCIFCGIELGWFEKKKLFCGNTTQILCKNCYSKYSSLSAVERAQAALNTGCADNIVSLQSYLANIYELKQESETEQNENKKNKVTNMKCLRCNGQMLDYGPATFKLGEETYFFSDWNRLITGSVTMNILRCEKCGKVEFYAFDDTEFSKQLE